MKILVIDDEPGLRKSLSLILGDAGYTVVTASDGEEGLRKLEEDRPELVLCDIRMPGLGGLDFLARARESGTEALILIMTAYGSMDLAVQAMKAGAYDYIPKPFGADEVLLTIRKAEEREQLQREVGRLRQEVRADRRFGEIVARSPGMMRVLELAGKVARHPSPVLVTGASGTGKELANPWGPAGLHQASDTASGAPSPRAAPMNPLPPERTKGRPDRRDGPSLSHIPGRKPGDGGPYIIIRPAS